MGPLRHVEQFDVLLFGCRGPAESADGGKPLGSADEVAEQGRLELEIEDAELAGCAQVDALEGVQNSGQKWDGDGEISRCNARENDLGDGGCESPRKQDEADGKRQIDQVQISGET